MAGTFDANAVDAALDDLLSSATIAWILAASETTYAGANTNALASVALTGADWTKAAGATTGRKATMAAKTGVTPSQLGTGTKMGFGISGSSTFKGCIDLAANCVITDLGGTVDFGSFSLTLPDAV